MPRHAGRRRDAGAERKRDTMSIRILRRLLMAILCVLSMAHGSFAALSANVVWEVRPTNGDNTFGEGFDASIGSCGTDYSQQTTAQVAFTDLATTGVVTTVTSVAGGFTGTRCN